MSEPPEFAEIRMQPLRKAEWMFLRDLKALDDIQLGMLAPSAATEEQMRKDRLTAIRLDIKGYIRTEPPPDQEGPWACIYYLTTKGLRAVQRKFPTQETGDRK